MCWKCPDCDHRASLGGNAGYHVTQTGHGAPTCVPLPKTQRGQGGLHVERGILYAFLDNDPAVERYITPAWCCEFDGRREYFPRCPVKDALLAASKVLGVEVVLRPDAFSHFLEKRVAEEQQAKDFRKVAEILRGLGFGGDLDGVTDLLREWRERGATLGPGWEG
jgi:hypothetical protein